jgi:type I restriction enzyme S subunit
MTEWKYRKLSEVVEFVSGFAFKSSDWLDTGIPVVKIMNVKNRVVNLKGCSYISPKNADISKSFLVKKGDLLFNMTGATLGAFGFYNLEMEARLNQRVGKFVPIDSNVLNLNFLAYFLELDTTQRAINDLAKGAAQPNISASEVTSLDIPLPPIDEQHKIVELLEDHLSRLDVALADVRSAKSKSSQLKSAILSKVFSGEFFEFDMPILSLEELAKVMNGDRGKNYPNKSARVISGIPFINAGHLDNDLLNVEEMDFISEERYKLLAAGKVELNDLLFCLRGSLGKVAINDKFIEGAIASSLAILRVYSKVLPKYLYYYFLSPLAAIEIKKHDNGTAQPNLSAANLRQFEVPTPTIEQQKVVIDFLDSELSRTIQASQTFGSLFSTASAMRRSLLQAAFTGQLTKEVVNV